MVADFVLVGSNQSAVRWWHPATWLLLSLSLMLYAVGRARRPG